MDKKLLQKYFRNQCTLKEIEQVINWFQTDEGKKYLEQRLDYDMHRYSEEYNQFVYPEIPSDEILENIKRERKRRVYHSKQREYWWWRVAVVFLICVSLAGISYWLLGDAGQREEQIPEVAFRTISTLENQQRLLTLSDGTQIRLNSNSSIKIPETFPADRREVSLEGEAFFNVSHDIDRPFSIHAEGAEIRVLGTLFNVKVSEIFQQVQVSVAEGRVSLSDKTGVEDREAILTENTFAQYQLDSGEILIEQTPVDNYLSWISGRLYFHNEPLSVVGRYLERLYEVSVQFETESLKELSVSTDIMKRDLGEVMDIITQTLGITYQYDEQNHLVIFSNTNNLKR